MRRLVLTELPGLSTLPTLRLLPQAELSIAGTNLTTLQPLTQVSTLTLLALRNNAQLSDLEALTGVTEAGELAWSWGKRSR